MKSKPKYNQNTVIRGALRRAFARSPLVQQKMSESRKEEPRFNKDGGRAKRDWVKRQCEVCSNWVGSSHISVDHINPVVSVEDGFQDWNAFVDRLWCNINNLQRICDECHDKKTTIERITRLSKRYTEELNKLENEIRSYSEKMPIDVIKGLKKTLSKYILKKKTVGLESIANRAERLRKNLI